MLKALDLEPIVPGAGALLSGAYGGAIVLRKPAKVRERALSLSE
jgi:hypothetical protein